MAETRRTIEGRWQCGQCDTPGILGRHRFCHACGSPREKGEMSFDFGATNADGSSTFESVTDADLLAAAEAGADWHCTHCDGGNRADWSHCTRCGASADGTLPPPPVPRAEPEPSPARATRMPLAATGGVFTALFTTCTGICGALCGVNAWVNRDIEVSAVVSDRQWVRVVHVERLTPADRVDWRDRLPAAAHPPGGEKPLQAGLGELYGCETLACWPRPPAKSTTARVLGHQWSRTISTRAMQTGSKSGWRSSMPGSGSMPVAGRGGSQGSTGSSCHSKVKTPERCRQVSSQVVCGTTRSCSIQDQGNGFAQEVCTQSPKYCTEYHQECTPAVYADWCTWTQLSWTSGRSLTTQGDDRSPYWPSISLRSNEAESRTETYRLKLAPLAGPPLDTTVTDETTWSSAAVGTLVTTDPVVVLAEALQVDGNRVDCEDGLPVGTIGTRERCRHQLWSWVDEPSLQVSGQAAAPTWPDASLGANGRERREEWVDVTLSWTRGEETGGKALRLTPAEFDAWPMGAAIPVVVDSDAAFIRFAE